MPVHGAGLSIISDNFMSTDTSLRIHIEKTFRNVVISDRNQIVFTIFRLIWNQKDVRLDPNQSENGKYNLISV